MFATDFPESNRVIDKPDSMSREECEPPNVWAGVHQGSPTIISCWKPTKEELEEINRTGKIWVWHWGNFLQPHAVSGTNPFIQPEQIQNDPSS